MWISQDPFFFFFLWKGKCLQSHRLKELRQYDSFILKQELQQTTTNYSTISAILYAFSLTSVTETEIAKLTTGSPWNIVVLKLELI